MNLVVEYRGEVEYCVEAPAMEHGIELLVEFLRIGVPPESAASYARRRIAASLPLIVPGAS